MARYAELGRTPVPINTVLLITSCLIAQNGGQAFRLTYHFAILDVVLRALARYNHDIAAAFGDLVRHWMRGYRMLRVLREYAPTRRDMQDTLVLKLSNAYSP